MQLESVKRRLSAFAMLFGCGYAVSMVIAEPSRAQEAQADETAGIEEIVITGSHIPQAGFDTTQPAFVIGSELLQDRGFTNVADALNESPQFSFSDTTPSDRQGRETVGQNFVNFFGIGSQRTLTLVNGRRFVSSNAPVPGGTPGSQVDLNNIPTGLVERIETVAIGGAPIYGSDAIAGTVNIILKKDFEGIEGSVQYGDLADKGRSAQNIRTDLTVGGNFGDGRGNVVMDFEYNRVRGLLQIDRPDTARHFSFLNIPGAANPLTLTQGLRFIVNSVGGIPLAFNFFPKFAGIGLDGRPVNMPGEDVLQFAPDGTLTTFDMGQATNTPFQSFGFGDGLDTAAFENLTAPTERFQFTSLGHYDITPYVTANVELWFSNDHASDGANQVPGFSFGLFSNGEGAPLRLSLDNPFLDPGARDTIRSALTNPATGTAVNPSIDVDGDGIPDSFFLTIRGEQLLGTNSVKRDATLFRFVVGLDGKFDVAGQNYKWDFSYNFGRSQANTSQPVLFDALLLNAINAVSLKDDADVAAFKNFFNLRNAQRVEPVTARAIRPGTNQLVGPDNVQVGDIVCAATLAPPPQPGSQFGIRDRDPTLDQCIPINLFGGTSANPEILNRIRLPSNNRTRNQQQVYTFNITGSPIEIPGGPVGIALGYEHRQESGAFTPDGLTGTSFGRGVPVQGADGSFNTDEVYGEALIPVVSEDMSVPFIEKIVVDAAFRRVNNSLAGNNTTWTAGGRLTPMHGFVLRGNFTRAIRAPAILELFLAPSQVIDFANDPCDARFIDSGPIPGARRTNCAAAGIPDAFTSIIVNGSRAQTISGDPNLKNEISNSFTIGAVMNPDFLEGFQLAIDWVDISLRNAIENLNGTATLNACFDVDPSVFANNDICNRITRAAPGAANMEEFQIQDIRTGFANAGFSKYRGLTAVLQYFVDLNSVLPSNHDWGALSITGNYNYIGSQVLSITGFDINPQKGEIGRSKHRFNINTRWNRQKLSWLWQSRWIGPAKFNRLDAPGTRDRPGVSGWWLFNTSISYQLTDNAVFRVIVDNVANNKPPFGAAQDGGTGITTYIDGILGRRWTFDMHLVF